MRAIDKRALREQSRGLRALLNEWDPIAGSPNDEYDCLLWPILRMLLDDASVDTLASFLSTELRDHFGVEASVSAQKQFASRVIEWFDSGWRDSNAQG